MVNTITELTDDQKLRLAYDKRMRVHQQVELTVDQLYAMALITLNNSVVPGDYPTLKTAVEAVAGVQNVNLLFDHHTLASLPADTKLVVNVSIDLNIQDLPEEP
jgi:hypothetical protein